MPETGLRYGRHNQLGLSAEPLRSKWVLPCCKMFADDGASYSQIALAGSQIFVKMYGRKHSDNLDYLGYISIWSMPQHQLRRYNQRLPPTERAAFFHSLRVHLQVMISKSLGQCQYDPCSLGWEMKNGVLAPVMTDLNPAPEELLEFIQCKCKVTSMNPCSTSLCCCLCSCLVLLLCSHV